ncbi:MAG: tetratricopeptide repeat protein [Phycisphaerae bacterium]
MHTPDDRHTPRNSTNQSDDTRDSPPRAASTAPASASARSGTSPTGGAVPSQDGGSAADNREASAPTALSGGGATAVGGAKTERPGEVIGRYRLLQQLGEGGFGIVWMAEQKTPVRRRVALKIIKLGMDTQQVIARFEAERQALAMMDHPHIAKVLDAGATETGRPYFVMDLVQGVPITDYCDQRNMPFRERLKLFVHVCSAVQHAHQKGIIHRDLKPSNVLVTEVDDQPTPKVIDFGIAKATQARLTEQTVFTEIGQFIGTPAYMSPEQADPIGVDIDTRSDIYSLGVLLYQLLTGVTPFDPRALRAAALDELKRIIREDDPPRPSTRLSSLGAERDTVARQRATEPHRLRTLLRGDLDWIIMKALEKDRARRYDTADGLALDIERYLRGDAVDAAPPSAAYRARKFVRRNRGLVSAMAAVAAALLIGIAGFAWQAAVARVQRDRAVDAEQQIAKRARELESVAEFQAEMLSQIDAADAGARLMTNIRGKFSTALEKIGGAPDERAARAESFGRDLAMVNATDTAADMIDGIILKPAIAAIDKRFAEQPLIDATLRTKLAGQYRTLGLSDPALLLAQQALATRERQLGATHPDTLVSLAAAADLLARVGRLDEAEAAYRKVFDERVRLFGENDERTLRAMANLGNHYRAAGRPNDAEPLLRTALERERRALGDKHRSTLITMNTLGYLCMTQGKYAEAAALWREAYETGRAAFGDDDRDVMVWMANLGAALRDQGDLAGAEPYLRRSMEEHRRVYGEDHPGTILSMGILTTLLMSRGSLDEGELLCRDAIARAVRVLGPEHPVTLQEQSRLGVILLRMNRLAEAEAVTRRVLEAQRRIRGAMHAEAISAAGAVGSVLENQGRYAEAETLVREALDAARHTLGNEHRDTLMLVFRLGGLLLRQNRLNEAEPLIRAAADARRRIAGEDHPETLITLTNLARLLDLQGRLDEAEALYREVMEKYKRVLGADRPDTLAAISNLAGTLRKLKRPAEAEPLYREALAGFERIHGDEHAYTAMVRDLLGRALTDLERYADAEMQLAAAQRVGTKSEGLSATWRRQNLEALVRLYEAWDQAEPDSARAAKTAEWKAKLDEFKASTQPAAASGAAPRP